MQHYTVELPASLPSSSDLVEHIQFLRSDHARFWYSNETGYRLSLPAVLLTDTGPGRGDMRGCYHRECDSARAGRPAWADYTFLARTVQTVIDTVTELSGAECPKSPRSVVRYAAQCSSAQVSRPSIATNVPAQGRAVTQAVGQHCRQARSPVPRPPAPFPFQPPPDLRVAVAEYIYSNK